MRFSLRRSSPMRTAICKFSPAQGSRLRVRSPLPSEAHPRAEAPSTLGLGTAARDVALHIKTVAERDAPPRRRHALPCADGVEPRAPANREPFRPQPLLGA